MNGPLRIVLPIHSFEPGGVERVALNLARHWQEAGHDVVVVLGRDEGLDRANVSRSLTYRLRSSILPTARFETLWMIWSLYLYLLRQRADVIYCPGNTYTIVCVMMKLFLGQRCPPVVVKVSNDLVRADMAPWSRLWYYMWLKLNGLFLEHFVGLAEPMEAEIVSAMGVDARRVCTIHDPALDRERLDRLASLPRDRLGRQPLHFVAIGRFEPQKNFGMLLRAFAAGYRPGDRLTLVGDGCGRAALEAEVRRMSLADQVVFTGHVPSADHYLGRADCLLLSSRYEGVPAVVIEAIAAGLPVVATNCSSSMEALLGGGTRGILVPEGDYEAMAAVISDPSQLPYLEADDRAFAGRFTLEQAAGTYVAVMREVIIRTGLVSQRMIPGLAG